jgi:DNA segregation ATPase FtsK/SpoIIIE, S-DNA-T family
MALAAPTRRPGPTSIRPPGNGVSGGASRLASPQLRGLIRRRLAELGAIFLAVAGVTALVALASYDVRDPSLNTATAAPAHNLMGPIGAMVADLALQGFGLAGALPALALLAWAWRIGSHRGLGGLALRLASLLAATPVLAGTLAGIPGLGGAALDGTVLAWPTRAGPGGAVGWLVATDVLAAGRDMLGPFGGLVVWALGAALAAVLTLLSLGLSAGEWRAAGRAARAGAMHGRSAAGLFARLGGRLASAGISIVHRLNGTPQPLHPYEPPEPDEPEELRREPRLARGREEPRAAITESAPPRESPAVRPAKAAQPAKKLPSRQDTLALEGTWNFPPLSLLAPVPPRSSIGAPTEEALQANARLLESVLADYGVQGQIVEIRPGPVVTLYELEPAPGIRSARVIGLADDVARSLSVTAVRIATVSGRNVIGIEVPNARRETVYLSELLSSADWEKHQGQGRLALALGKDISGSPVIADLARMPHLLVAGTTGSGKSVGINAMILSILYKMSPDQCRLILIDPKMLELSVYEGIPHLMAPVVTEPGKAVVALKWTVREMERRYRAMSQLSVRNVAGYNERVAQARAKGEVVTRRVQTGFDSETGKPIFEDQPLALEPLPLIVVVIDEMADLMMVAGKEIEAAVQRLAQMARAAGIHVVMATQRPSVDVITGTIKANFPTRISFTVISKFDSRTILGEQGAEQLLGQGDMLYMAGGGRITRVHGPFVSDKEVEEIVAYLREQGEPAYLEEVTEAPDEADTSAMSGIAGASDGEKGLFDQAVDVVSREGKASTSFIQRHLQIGYNRAARLIEQMEKEGIVGPANHVGKREVLVRRRDDD